MSCTHDNKDSYLSRFHQWYSANENSIELKNKYERCKRYLEGIGESPPSFEEWAKVVFDLRQ